MPDTNESSSMENGRQHGTHEEIQVANDFVHKYFIGKAGAWTALFTCVLTVFTGLLYLVNNQANRTAIESQRAFINFSGAQFQPDVDPKTKQLRGTRVYWNMTNNGTTPANTVEIEWNLSLGSVAPDKNTDFDSLPQTERQRLVLGPKASYIFKPVYLSMEDWENVADGKEHLFFWGWAVYKDIFDRTPVRLSEFCTDVTNVTWSNPSLKHTDINNPLSTVNPPCPTHNCYDENCEDYSKRTR
jgi:hypothetical protein